MHVTEHEVEPPSSRPCEDASPEVGEAPPRLGAADKDRLRGMFAAHYDSVWRLLRRLGLDPASADDAAQQVFLVAARRLSDIDREKERSFLCGTATRVAAGLRQKARRRGEEALETDDAAEGPSSQPTGADELVDRKRKRELLDRILGQMEEELRVVLVLAEMEDLGKREIADILAIPEGTAASRLRRAREDFQARLTRHLAREGR